MHDPARYLPEFAKRYPAAWKQTDVFRAGRGDDLPDWPEWCYLPIAATLAIVSEQCGVDARLLGVTHPQRGTDPAIVAALAAWRVSRGVYRFDPALYPALIDTQMGGDIPCEVLYRLPEWCVYVETPDLTLGGAPLLGAFAHLEHDINTGRPELRLLLDTGHQLLPFALHLGRWSLATALQKMFDEAARNGASIGLDPRHVQMPGDDVIDQLARAISPILALVLYLCAAPNEIGRPGARPTKPVSVRTKKGTRTFAAEKNRKWDVGVRIGAALRFAYQQAERGEGGTGAGGGNSRGPHVRKAHWHCFRFGAKKRSDGTEIPTADRPFDVRWLPPIPVNIDDPDELPTVIRPVVG